MDSILVISGRNCISLGNFQKKFPKNSSVKITGLFQKKDPEEERSTGEFSKKKVFR